MLNKFREKGQKNVQNDKKFCLLSSMDHEQYIIFSKFRFSRLLWGVKGQNTAQNDIKIWSSCYVSKEPYIIRLWFMVHMCKIMIFPGVFLCVSEKIQHCKYLNYYVFYWVTSTFFLIDTCFSSSSINAKKKFWDMPYLLHMCVVFKLTSLCIWVYCKHILSL